ncbi:branched-chain amino acid ABC transporter ATP-binding protein/permease [Micromonospora yasonensis]|uniref:branched-chain amino acid ABC transporter ATP-binding protein/permease n=1 Tax=Micromonospora yasonensis TaxID=1128667 RepID=UPI0022312DA4|nr:branched-chain amino acid ABC transporter ATP-binding protein/permease [Micromonospora yasonensis]MCW3841489.1 branched-chain amino acid ABC transporter ATP-binding protein/permease [Micromonospora yasonensis]
MALPRQLRALPSWTIPLVLGVLLVAAPWLGISSGTRRLLLLTCILALLSSGLNLSFGYAGELALGQAAMYATGAYLTGYLAMHWVNDLALLVLVAAAAALVVGLVSGVPGLRLGGWSLAMTSFFLVLLVPQFLDLLEHYTGGAVGMVGIPRPRLFGAELSSLDMYVVVAVITVCWFALMRNLITSRHGVAFQVLRESPILASSLGISVYRMKLTAYAIGAIPAGIAGALFAYVDKYLAPHSFGFTLAVTVLAASILGGAKSIYGPFVGAAVMQYGPLRSTEFEQYTQIVYGIFLILAGTLVANGLAGLADRAVARLAARWRPTPDVLATGEAAPAGPAPDGPALPPLTGARLEVTDVRKRFGGLQALGGVTLTAVPGQITALIGPNGSGKTTLLNVICGYYRIDSGSIHLGDAEITGRSTHDVARAGVARTFQTPLFPQHITVREAVAAGAYSPRHVGMAAAILRLPRYRRAAAADRAEVDDVLRLVGAARLADVEAASLPLGTRRLLEVARALVARPKVLLLDEVASGLDEDEIDRLAELIRAIRAAGTTVILVEHNFRLVLDLADAIHVLAQSELIASGTPDEIENHPRVLSEYLGVRQEVHP